MSFARNSMDSFDLSKSEELKYQLSEARYHLENIRLSLKESVYHLKKFHEHVSLAKDCNKIFIDEV